MTAYKRDICPGCHAKEPRLFCSSCKRPRHRVDQNTAMCPGCAKRQARISAGLYRERPKREIVCEACGRECLTYYGSRDLCHTCYYNMPRRLCRQCKKMRVLFVEETGICVHCTRIVGRPVAKCAGCSRTCYIYDQDARRCKKCSQLARHREKKRQRKVTCSVCAKQCCSVLVNRAICQLCYTKEHRNYDQCTDCKKYRAIYNYANGLCHRCYSDHRAPGALRNFVSKFTTPYPYNKSLFDLFVTSINWKSINHSVYHRTTALGSLLRSQQIPDPLTWEYLEELFATLGPSNKVRPTTIRGCLRDIGHLLAAQGKLEPWELFRARRLALIRIVKAPKDIQPVLKRYVEWERTSGLTPNTIGEDCACLVTFWSWCAQKKARSPAEVQVTTVNDYLLSLAWQWQCMKCESKTPFDPRKRKAPRVCVSCEASGSTIRVKRYNPRSVSRHRSKIWKFFQWARIERLTTFNPVRIKYNQPHITVTHYPVDVVKRLCAYVTSPGADPLEALTLYLIIFHALNIWELRNAQIPAYDLSRPGNSATSLAEKYCLLVPSPPPSKGALSPGRSDTILKFPSSAATWLKPLLERVESQRLARLKNPKHEYLLVAFHCVRPHNPASAWLVRQLVQSASERILGFKCSPNTLRKTVAVMYTDRVGAGILRRFGWGAQQAFAYTWAHRSTLPIVSPGDPASTSSAVSVSSDSFPSPKKGGSIAKAKPPENP
jgi:hypothetical protein